MTSFLFGTDGQTGILVDSKTFQDSVYESCLDSF